MYLLAQSRKAKFCLFHLQLDLAENVILGHNEVSEFGKDDFVSPNPLPEQPCRLAPE